MSHTPAISAFDRMKKTIGKRYWLVCAMPVVVMLSGCASEEKSDAYGQFEAIETTISSEVPGKLLQYTVEEGQNLDQNKKVALVDTTRLSLQKRELDSQLESVQSKIVNVDARIDVRQEELDLARTNLKRIRALREDEAATQQQLDDAGSRVRTIEKGIYALRTEKQSIRAEIRATESRIDQIDDQLKDARLINPIKGTVLTSYVEPFEIVQQGQPLYRIAALDTLELRIYISGAQLPSVKLGQNVEVLVDENTDENRPFSGKISWISSEAEFTPEQIQTKEERVTQVYAVKVRVPNSDATLKIGMPGEVNFN